MSSSTLPFTRLAKDARAIEEANYSINGYLGHTAGLNIETIPGSLPVILSACHAVGHIPVTKKGKIRTKEADVHTGALTRQLAELTGATAVIYRRHSLEEPNGFPLKRSPYKQTLYSVIQEMKPKPVLFLDIHGLDDCIKANLIIGTAYGKSIAGYEFLHTELKDMLRSDGIKKIRDHSAPWYTRPDKWYTPDADYPTSNTLWIYNQFKIPAMQLEVGWYCRDFYDYPDDYTHFLRSLAKSVKKLVASFDQGARYEMKR